MGFIGCYLVAISEERAFAFAGVAGALAVRIGFRVRVILGMSLLISR